MTQTHHLGEYVLLVQSILHESKITLLSAFDFGLRIWVAENTAETPKELSKPGEGNVCIVT